MTPKRHLSGRGVTTVAAAVTLFAALSFIVAACGGGGEEKTATPAPGGTAAATATKAPKLSGKIIGDGSTTVFPITEAVAEEFRKVQPGVDVVVGESGTGGGFKKFINGETTFNDASRPITADEKSALAAKGIEYVEFTVAYDGIAVVVNPSSDFVSCLTVDELKRIWEPGSMINNWKDVRPGFPDKPLTLYGPTSDNGTFDYFTEAIVGTAKASRSDYSASTDSNVRVQGVAGDKGALGYFGLAYYEENASKLRLLQIDGGAGCVAPSMETVVNGTYKPLSRPLFVYVRKDALQRPEVREFLRFYFTEGRDLAVEVGYAQAPDSAYANDLANLQ